MALCIRCYFTTCCSASFIQSPKKTPFLYMYTYKQYRSREEGLLVHDLYTRCHPRLTDICKSQGEFVPPVICTFS